MLSLSMFPERLPSSDISNSKRKPPIDFAQKKGGRPLATCDPHTNTAQRVGGQPPLWGKAHPSLKRSANARQNQGIPSLTKPSINLLTKADAVTHHSMDYLKKNHGRPTVIGTTGITGLRRSLSSTVACTTGSTFGISVTWGRRPACHS